MKYRILFFIFLCFSFGCKEEEHIDPGYIFPDSTSPKDNIDKSRYIWIDAAANFNDFANSKENIIRDLKLAKETGFTDIVVDIRPTSGDILYKSAVAGSQEVKWLAAWIDGIYSKVDRTATWDYLQAFIEEGHRIGLRVHAGFNTMVGGYSSSLGNEGLLYRDSSKKEWATTENLITGIINTLENGQGIKFLNPTNDNVKNYICDLLKDLARYDLDGIFLDRGRFDGIQSDFSPLTRQKFETYLGQKVVNFPQDIMPIGAEMKDVMNTPPTTPYYKQWLEFRAKVMYDFMAKAKDAITSVNPKIKFGVYVGGWYSTYYEVGVNWASPKYNTSAYFPKWASTNYNKYGYAALMDHMLIGAYAHPSQVYGSNEWTMQGFCKLAMDKIKGDCKMVAGGPDVGNWDINNNATQQQENEAIINSVKACMDECDGYFLFDMIHLKMANQWNFAKKGIDITIKQ